MRGIKKVGLWAAGMLIAVGGGVASFAAQAISANNIYVNVVTTPGTNFTYSTVEQPSFTAVTFYLRNEASSFLNNARFRASVSAGEFPSAIPPGSGYSCTVAADRKSIDCNIAAAPLASVTFDTLLKSPAAGTASSIVLNWNVRYGLGASEGFITTEGTPGLSPTTLTANSDSSAQGAAVEDPIQVATGTTIPSPIDPFTVSISVDPKGDNFVIASIAENPVACPSGRQCVQLDVSKRVGTHSDGTLDTEKAKFDADPTKSDLDDKLVFVLRFDPSLFSKKLNLRNLYFFYTSDPGEMPVFNNEQIRDCLRDANGVMQPPGPNAPPCIAELVVFTKRTALDPSLIGVVQAVFWASSNGFVDTGW